MTVEQLIKLLLQCNPSDIVVMSSDAEGNSYSPVEGVDATDRYRPDSTYSGEVGLRELTEYHKTVGYTEEDVIPEDEGQDCVVVYPVN